MNHNVICRCGWEGIVADGLERSSRRCPACNEPLPAGSTGPPPPVTDVGPSAASTPPSAPPAVMHDPQSSGEPTNVTGKISHVVQSAIGYVLFAFRFYRDNRTSILSGWRVWINEHMPSLDRPDAIRREIRISLDEQEGVHEDAGVWHVDLPIRCVVCGAKPTGGWIVEPRTVLDPYGPIVGPLAGLILGIYLSWWYQSQFWLLLSLLAGVLVGYASRKNVQFLLRFMRCAKHAEPGKLPEVIVLHRHLVLRVGAREVKLAFLQRGRDVGHMDEIALPTEIMVSPPHEMIALAEDVHPGVKIVPEQSTRLPTAEDENAHSRPPAGPDEYRLSQ